MGCGTLEQQNKKEKGINLYPFLWIKSYGWWVGVVLIFICQMKSKKIKKVIVNKTYLNVRALVSL